MNKFLKKKNVIQIMYEDLQKEAALIEATLSNLKYKTFDEKKDKTNE